MRCYRTIPVTSTRRVVQIPPIGSFLIESESGCIRLHVTAPTAREIDELMAQLDAEAARAPPGQVHLDWSDPHRVVVPA